MKFKDLFIFLEQDDDHPDFLDIDEPEDEDRPEDQDGNNEPDQPEQPGGQQNPQPNQAQHQPKPKKLSITKEAKMKWREQNPQLTDDELEEGAAFFRTRKPHLKIYHPAGYVDPNTDRPWVNTYEVNTLVMRFPELSSVLSDQSRMGDLRSYSWEVIDFWMDMIQPRQQEVNDTNVVPGSSRSTEENLQEAKDVWLNSNNLLVNEEDIKVRRIESKAEAVYYGSIQRFLYKKRHDAGNNRGNLYWCATVPPNDGRINLWSDYRPGGYRPQGFYFVWNLTVDENDPYYFCSVNPLPPEKGGYSFVDLYNETTGLRTWDQVTERIPKLAPYEQLFKYFGRTKKEEVSITLDKISLQKGNRFYLGIMNDDLKEQFVEEGRHIHDPELYRTFPPDVKKLYIAKLSPVNNDLAHRFKSDDPGQPFAMLNEIYINDKNLYKFLDTRIKEQGIPEGVRALKKLLLGNDWVRGMSDDEKNYTLVQKRVERGRWDRSGLKSQMSLPYGILNTQTADIVKDPEYKRQIPSMYLGGTLNEQNIMEGTQYILQKYAHQGPDGRVDQENGFYFFYPKDATAKLPDGTVSENYLKGKYMEIEEARQFIAEKTNSGELSRVK